MNTLTVTQAAAKAGVSPSTICRWCRMGAIAATKDGRRWHIDPTSLNHRISLGIRHTHPRQKRTVEITPEALVAIGGSRWTKGGKDRIYLNGWARFIDLEVERYRTGNICSASLRGEGIPNAEARRLLAAVDKVYFDAEDGQIHIKWGYGDPRSMTRDELAEAIVAGIRAAIANL